MAQAARPDDLVQRLLVEVTAQRLITRSIIAHLFAVSDVPMRAALKAFEEAVEKMSPDVVPIAGLDPALHRRAFALARKRAQEMAEDIGAIVARPRRSKSVAAPAAETRTEKSPGM